MFFLYCWCSPWSEKVVLIIFFGNFFFGVKFVSAYIDAFFNKKNGGQIFSPKKDQTRGGSDGGLAKDQTFFRIFFLGILPLCRQLFLHYFVRIDKRTFFAAVSASLNWHLVQPPTISCGIIIKLYHIYTALYKSLHFPPAGSETEDLIDAFLAYLVVWLAYLGFCLAYLMYWLAYFVSWF